jgi:hypothetical protein
MPTTQNPLPSITRFLAGLITNRNPIDTPFSVMGQQLVQHHDAMVDGLNMELSSYATLVRRPGFTSFISVSATPREFFQYKDLNGVVSLFFDEGGQLYQGTTLASNSVGPNLWSVVPAGNFVYAVNGKTAVRFNNTALTTPLPMGIAPLQQPPRVNINTQSKPYFLSSFIPTGNTIAGLFTVSDSNGARLLTITIGSTLVHFNVTFTGNQIAPNLNHTIVNAQTQTGTAPNTTTTNVITDTSGYTGTAAGAGITNGAVAYYPNQGLSSLDFDMAYTAPMTMNKLVTLINTATPTITAANIPASATNPLAVFVSAVLVSGMVASTLYPDTAATAFSLTSNGK